VYSYEMLEACVDAGITPGVFLELMPDDDLRRFTKEYGSELYVTIATSLGNNSDSQKYYIKQIQLLRELGIRYVEIADSVDSDDTTYDLIINIIHFLKQDSEVTIISKRLILGLIEYIDTIVVKGNDAGGHNDSAELSTSDMFDQMQSKYPEKTLIACGGIHSSDQIRDYMSRGAAAVSIGTLFACSEESPLSLESKNKLIDSTAQNLSKFDDTGQQALIFSKIYDDDINKMGSLRLGIETGITGHVYAGHAVDHITEILPMREIVNKLTYFMSEPVDIG